MHIRKAAAALAVIMALSAFGCGGNEQAASSASAAPTEAAAASETEAAVTPVPTPEPTTEPTATPDPEHSMAIEVAHTIYGDSGESVEEYTVYAEYASFTADTEPLSDEELSRSAELNDERRYGTTYYMPHTEFGSMADYYNVSGSLFISSEITADTVTESGHKTLWTYVTDEMRIFKTYVTEDAVYAIGYLAYDDMTILHEFDSDGPGVYYTRETEDGQTVYLKKYEGPIREQRLPAVMKLSLQGEYQWLCSWNNGWNGERVASILETPDGGITVFSDHTERTETNEVDVSYLVVSRIGANGDHLGSVLNETENFVRAKEAFVFEDGYAAACDDGAVIGVSETDGIAIFDASGRLTDTYFFTARGTELHFFEQTLCRGKLFLCTYTLDPDDVARQRFLDGGKYEVGEDITELLKENCSAILLVFDLEELEPAKVYEAFAAYGGYNNVLNINESGCVEWELCGILYGQFSGSDMSFITCRFKVDFCRFDEEGNIAEIGFAGRLSNG